MSLRDIEKLRPNQEKDWKDWRLPKSDPDLSDKYPKSKIKWYCYLLWILPLFILILGILSQLEK